jgi:hypothetical protein
MNAVCAVGPELKPAVLTAESRLLEPKVVQSCRILTQVLERDP